MPYPGQTIGTIDIDHELDDLFPNQSDPRRQRLLLSGGPFPVVLFANVQQLKTDLNESYKQLLRQLFEARRSL